MSELPQNDHRYCWINIPGRYGQSAGKLILDTDVVLKMWQWEHAMKWEGTPTATEDLPSMKDVEENVAAAGGWIGERTSRDIVSGFEIAKGLRQPPSEPAPTPEESLESIDYGMRIRDNFVKHVAALQLARWMGGTADAVLGKQRPRLQVGERAELSLGEYLGIATFMGDGPAIDAVFKWCRRFSRRAPKTLDWPTILRIYGNTKLAIAQLLPQLKREKDWLAFKDTGLGKRITAAGQVSRVLPKRPIRVAGRALRGIQSRREPAAIAAAIVALEYRESDPVGRLKASTIQKEWKRRRVHLPEGDPFRPK